MVGKDTRESHETTEKIEVVLVLDTSGSMNYCIDRSQKRMQQIESEAVDGAERSGDQLHRRHRDHQRHHPGRKQQSANRHRSIRADIRRGEFLTSDTAALKSSVSRLSANGATPADKGMAAAQTALLRARPGAKKVVIFFADGVPTTQNTLARESPMTP